jgi:hypothetical protein
LVQENYQEEWACGGRHNNDDDDDDNNNNNNNNNNNINFIVFAMTCPVLHNKCHPIQWV